MFCLLQNAAVPGNGDTWDAWGNLGQRLIYFGYATLVFTDSNLFPMKLQHHLFYSLFINSSPFEEMNMGSSESGETISNDSKVQKLLSPRVRYN